MNESAPFQPSDLDELGEFLARADAVVPMSEIAAGRTDPRVIGLRHDCDNVIGPAVQLAEWEAEHGIRSTYFILHTAPYWQEKETLVAALDAIADCDHEIGFHLNAITVSIETGQDPVQDRDHGAVEELRSSATTFAAWWRTATTPATSMGSSTTSCSWSPRDQTTGRLTARLAGSG